MMALAPVSPINKTGGPTYNVVTWPLRRAEPVYVWWSNIGSLTSKGIMGVIIMIKTLYYTVSYFKGWTHQRVVLNAQFNQICPIIRPLSCTCYPSEALSVATWASGMQLGQFIFCISCFLWWSDMGSLTSEGLLQ